MQGSIKGQARRLVEQLPESAGWDEPMERIWIRQSVEAGLADSEADRITPVEKIRREYLLSE